MKGRRSFQIMSFLFFMSTIFFFAGSALAVPGLISYQGKLTDNTGTPLEGAQNMRFRLYDNIVAGTELWNETQTGVLVTSGIYDVRLGSMVSLDEGLFAGDSVYLQVEIYNGSAWEVLAPRQRLTSAAFSFKAADAETLQGKTVAQIHTEETDPTVPASVKDGVAWSEVSAKPPGFADDTDNDSGGDISGVTAGTGLAGGGTSGDVTLNIGAGTGIAAAADSISVNTAVIQQRVSGICGAGSSIRTVNVDGSVVCEMDDTGSLTLPYSGSVSSGGNAFAVTQDGSGWGISGTSNGTFGIRGESFASGGAGVGGYSNSSGGSGVIGQGNSKGVFGYTSQPNAYGVYGEAPGFGGTAVYGTASGTSGTGVYGSGTAWGGYFVGNVFASGNLGIGTTSPVRNLHIYGSGPRILIETNDGFSPEVNFRGTGSDWAIYRHSGLGDLRFYQAGDKVVLQNSTGNVGIGTSSPTQKLTVRGNIEVQSASTGTAVVQIGEGLDYAEGFNVTKKDGISSGTVLVIDPANPGKLALSSKPYDSRVAGIVAGANSLGSGVKLGAGQFDHDVALAGRVYCKVDGGQAGIEPGDLLTSSEIPGYAMKAEDHERAWGAIIGKAMERLERGTSGQILVLVTLQ